MKTVLITGASGGIGSAAAVLFAQKGYNVIINYLHSEKAALSLCEAISCYRGDCTAVRADVSSADDVDIMFRKINDRFGGADILINNAGISSQRLFTDISYDEWNRMIGVNLTGVFNCCKAALPYMIHQKSGSIVNVSSVWGQTGASCEVHYSAAKAGVIGLTKALAKELGPSGIRVNCVAPGVIDTRMNAEHSIEVLKELAEEIPLGRIAIPEEAARAILFLAEDSASYITGQVISPNGGFYI